MRVSWPDSPQSTSGTDMTDHESSGNSIWLGIFVLLLAVLGASIYINWQQHSQVVAMQAEVDELRRQYEELESREVDEQLRRAVYERLWEQERRREEHGGDLFLE